MHTVIDVAPLKYWYLCKFIVWVWLNFGTLINFANTVCQLFELCVQKSVKQLDQQLKVNCSDIRCEKMIICVYDCMCLKNVSPRWLKNMTLRWLKSFRRCQLASGDLSWYDPFWVSHCHLSLIHIWRCRRIERCRSRWSPYH